jgi:predicted  nucleic acid-binding Zn-ribbon protein
LSTSESASNSPSNSPSNQIRALEVLAAVDAELRVLEDHLASEKGSLETLTRALRDVETKVDHERIALSTTEKMRQDFAQEVRSMNQQIEASREKMGRARNERETNAVQREMEELRKLLKDKEDDVAKMSAAADGIRAQLQGLEGEMQRLRDELGAIEGEATGRIAQAEGERKAKQEVRDGAAKAVPPALLRKYDVIRVKRGFALTQTTDGTCRACHIALAPQLFHRLRREPTLDQCPSCNRFIYFVNGAAEAGSEG